MAKRLAAPKPCQMSLAQWRAQGPCCRHGPGGDQAMAGEFGVPVDQIQALIPKNGLL